MAYENYILKTPLLRLCDYSTFRFRLLPSFHRCCIITAHTERYGFSIRWGYWYLQLLGFNSHKGRRT